MTRADEKNVARAHPHPVVALRGLEVRREYVLPRLDPWDPPHARHVEQYAAADEPILEAVYGTHLLATTVRGPVGLTVEECALERHVAEGVDVRVPVVVVIDAHVVLGEPDRPRTDVDI